MKKENPGPIRLIYVGRIVEEKGFGILLGVFKKIYADKKLSKKIQIDIYGSGYLSSELTEQANLYTFLNYHGFQKKVEIKKYRKNAHFTLMPSKFLETFGLSALDGLAHGTPIIGFSKGGLAQFIGEKYKVVERSDYNEQVNVVFRKIKKIVHDFSINERKKDSKEAKKLFKQYTREIWYSKFETFFGDSKPSKKILLVSDYSKDIGGIENWILTLKVKLESKGHKVEIMGGCQTKVTKKQIFRNLFCSSYNYNAGKRIEKKVNQFNPDLIWRHSVHRVLGRYPLSLIGKRNIEQRIMYHDFGLFHPFPSKVYSTQQLVEARTLIGFMKEGMKSNFLSFPLLIAKWFSYILIKKFLKRHIDLHLTPSAYMLSYVNSKGYIGQDSAIDYIPHFVDD